MMSLPSFVERGRSVFDHFINSTERLARSWPLRLATNTDRVAVVIFQPAKEIRRLAYIIRWNLRRLGSLWALQIFYGGSADRTRLSRSLGNPSNIVWTQIRLQGERREVLGYQEAQWFRLGLDFWGAIRPEHEHVLVFEADTLMLRGPGCVDRFLNFDYVGAPWHEFFTTNLGYPRFGGNGGLSLRRRSKILEVVESRACKARRGTDPAKCPVFEDEVIVRLLAHLNASFPPRDQAARFAVESVFHPATCGFHKPWYYQEPEVMLHLLSSADMD